MGSTSSPPFLPLRPSPSTSAPPSHRQLNHPSPPPLPMAAAPAADPISPSPAGGLAAAGGGAGDDDNNDPFRSKGLYPAHGVDADPIFPEDEEQHGKDEEAPLAAGETGPPPRGRRPSLSLTAAASAVPQQCTVCNKVFGSLKALHGHMRKHPIRSWRGQVPATALPEGAEIPKRRFICSSCNQEFPTRQALGGHRASHKSKKGCYEMAKEAREFGDSSRGGRNRRRRGSQLDEAAAASRKEAAAAMVKISVEAPMYSRKAPSARRPPLHSSTATSLQRINVPWTSTALIITSTTTVTEVTSPIRGAAAGASTATSGGGGRRRRRRRRRSLDLNRLPEEPSEDTTNNGSNGNGSSTTTSTGSKLETSKKKTQE